MRLRFPKTAFPILKHPSFPYTLKKPLKPAACRFLFYFTGYTAACPSFSHLFRDVPRHIPR